MYLKLKEQASRAAVWSEVDFWWVVCSLGHKYGLLADIIGGEKYKDLSGVDRNDYNPSIAKPDIYDATISAATNTFQCERRTTVCKEELKWWNIRRGLYRGL